MDREDAAPCRHIGMPDAKMVTKVVDLINGLSASGHLLDSAGISPADYASALPMAIQKMKGSVSATTSGSKGFVVSILNHLQTLGLIKGFDIPGHTASTVYRVYLEGEDVAIIQKGCPDSTHSSIAWTAPDWASETYLWWVCSGASMEPGEHVAKGVNRLKTKFFSEKTSDTRMLDGIIFHSPACGGPERPCPKMRYAVPIDDRLVPPPCIWTMPDKGGIAGSFNWDGSVRRRFPGILLSGFGIGDNNADVFTGHVGFQDGPRGKRTTITSRYGPVQSTTYKEG